LIDSLSVIIESKNEGRKKTRLFEARDFGPNSFCGVALSL